MTDTTSTRPRNKAVKETAEARDARRDAAFERGWVDSLRGYYALSMEPIDDGYYYKRGWDMCTAYRWIDPKNNGVAPDPNYRPSPEEKRRYA
jgi:hypothetical protein